MNGPWGGVGQPRPVRVTHTWQVGLSRQQTGYYLRADGGAFPDAQDYAEAAADWFVDNIPQLLETEARLVSTDVVNLVTKEGATVTHNSVVGSSAIGAGTLPAFICVVASLKSGLRQKIGQGRMFLPIRGELGTAGDTLTPAVQTVFEGIMSNLVSRFVGAELTGNFHLVNLHEAKPEYTSPKTGKVRPAVGRMFYDVNAIVLNGRLTFLRSRKAGTGS